jgi:hypothetical protein
MTKQNRMILLVACALGLVLSAFVREWFTSPPVFVGLWGVELCNAGCHGVRWDELPGAQEDLYLAGYVAFAAAIAGAILLVMIATGNTRVTKAARRVLVVASIAMGYFVLRAYAFNALPGVGPSFMLPIGLASAIGGAVMLRERR